MNNDRSSDRKARNLGIVVGLSGFVIMEVFTILALIIIDNRIRVWFLHGTVIYSLGILFSIALVSALLGYGIFKRIRLLVFINSVLLLGGIGILTYHLVRVFQIHYPPLF
jgi:hypothetical protein